MKNGTAYNIGPVTGVKFQIVGTPLPPLLESTIRRNHPDHTDHPGENPRSLSSPKTTKNKKN